MKQVVPKSSRGFAMVTSLFLILLLFTGMTIMVANARTEMRMSQQAFETTQYRFAAQGAVNKLHSLLLSGSAPEDFPRGSPLKVTIGSFEDVEAWVIEDESTGVYHLRSQLNGAAFSKVIVQSSDGGVILYSQDDKVLKFAGVNDLAWSALPKPPSRGYNEDGLRVNSFSLQPTGQFQANHNGQMAAFFSGTNASATYLWDEGTKSWSDVPPTPGWWFENGDVVPGGPPTVRPNVYLGGTTLFAHTNVSRPAASPISVVFSYDLATRVWKDRRGPFDGARLERGFVGPDDTFLAEVDDNGRRRLASLSGDSWTELPPLPAGRTLRRSRAIGPEGELYVVTTTDQLYVFGDGEWTEVDVPLDEDGESLGELRSVDAEGGLLFYNPETEKLHRWEEAADPKSLPGLEKFEGISGGGSDGEIAQGFKTTATY